MSELFCWPLLLHWREQADKFMPPCGSFEFFKWIFMWMISKYMVIYSPGPLVCHPSTIARGLSVSIVSEYTSIPVLMKVDKLNKISTELNLRLESRNYICSTSRFCTSVSNMRVHNIYQYFWHHTKSIDIKYVIISSNSPKFLISFNINTYKHKIHFNCQSKFSLVLITF